MARLDSMTKKELSKLNFASETLLWLGAIKMVFFYFMLFGVLVISCSCFRENVNNALMVFAVGGLSSLFMYSSAVVYKEARSAMAKLFFKVSVITLIVNAILIIISIFLSATHPMPITHCPPSPMGGYYETQSNSNMLPLVIFSAIFLLLVSIWSILVLNAAKQNLLFGENNFTSEQITAARKKLKNNESFTDEELPAPYSDSKKAKVHLIIAFMGEFSVILIILHQLSYVIKNLLY